MSVFTWTDPHGAVHRHDTADGGLWLNLGCGTHHAAAPWLNTDTVANDNTHPDLVVTPADPVPFPDASADRVYLGHVLEHIEHARVPGFLADVHRVLRPGAELLVTGPDVYRTITRWRDGAEPWVLVCSVLEHAALPGSTDWPEALHQWNCHEARVLEFLADAGFVDLVPMVEPPTGWPVVNWSAWQCCVHARRP